MADESLAWFQVLKALGRSQGFLTFAQVNEGVPSEIVDPEEISEVVEQLERFGIRIVPNSQR